MGASMDKSAKPEELTVFKKEPLDNLLANIEIPERPENRKPTDQRFLIAFFVVALLLVPFLIYTLVYSDIDRFGGYDNCGNICGKKNPKYDEWSCTGRDFTDKRYLQFDRDVNTLDDVLVPRECVSSCDKGEPILGYCFKNRRALSTTDDPDFTGARINAYLRSVGWRITLACFLSLAFTLAMLVLLRTATAAMVWSILAGVFVFGAIIVGSCWYGYFHIPDDPSDASGKQGLLYLSIFLTVILVILFCVMVFMYKKVQLVIILLKEAMKAAFAMPQLIFIPILTFIVQAIILILVGTTAVYMSTSGSLTEIVYGYLEFEPNFFMNFTQIFNIIMAVWALQFINGIQYMIIGGAVSKWYFAPNKEYLNSPIKTSAYVTFKFHLGSVAFGSLVITIVAVIRALVSSVTKNKNLKACADICLKGIEDFLKFLSKNSYILTAMHGKPFFKSGKRAAKIIFDNIVNIAAVNYIGDFILGMAQLIIALVSVLLAYGIMTGAADPRYVWIVYFIVFFISLLIAGIFFAVFETVIDTIFLCFCEDSLLNDGMARPYAMSRDLMEFVENSKAVFKNKDKKYASIETV